MTKKLTLVFSGLVLVGCGEFVPSDHAVRAARNQGYEDITVTGRHGIFPHYLGGCSENDAAAFDVTATNSRGRRVNLTVCCGLIVKGCTIRQ